MKDLKNRFLEVLIESEDIDIDSEIKKIESIQNIEDFYRKTENNGEKALLSIKNDKRIYYKDLDVEKNKKIKEAIVKKLKKLDYEEVDEDELNEDEKKIYNRMERIVSSDNVYTRDNKVQTKRKDDFELLGKVIAYRSALGVIARVGGDEVREAIENVFEQDNNNVLSQLTDLEEYFRYSAACNVISRKLEREKEGSEEYKKIMKINDKLIDSTTRIEGIIETESVYDKSFKDEYTVIEQTFNNGMKAQQEEMQKPDYKWKDPATGKEPQGIKENVSKVMHDALSKIGNSAEALGNKIMNTNHTFENDMAKLAVLGVKCMVGGIKSGLALFRKVFNKSANFSIMQKMRIENVKKAINDFSKEYEKAKKEKYLPSDLEKNKDVKEEIREKNKDLKKKFKNLMYEQVIPYLYKHIIYLVSCANGTDDVYIIKQQDDGYWNTNNNKNQKNEMGERLKLIESFIDLVVKEFDRMNIWTEFKDIKMEELMTSISSNIKYSNTISNNISNWIAKIDIENQGTQNSEIDGEKYILVDDLNKLKNVGKIYDKKIMIIPIEMKNSSNNIGNLKDKLKVMKTGINSVGELPYISKVKIVFKEGDDGSSKLGGIIANKKKEENDKLDDINVDNIENLNKSMKVAEESIEEILQDIDLDKLENGYKNMSMIISKIYNDLKEKFNGVGKEKEIKEIENEEDGTDTLSLVYKIQKMKELFEGNKDEQ